MLVWMNWYCICWKSWTIGNIYITWSLFWIFLVLFFFSERILEDHDCLVENMVMWTRDTKNKILFEERQEKYDLFRYPEVSHLNRKDWSILYYFSVNVLIKIEANELKSFSELFIYSWHLILTVQMNVIMHKSEHISK